MYSGHKESQECLLTLRGMFMKQPLHNPATQLSGYFSLQETRKASKNRRNNSDRQYDINLYFR